jgi:DNA-binding transcriptional ArsR family regulator
VNEPPPLSQQETIRLLLERSRRPTRAVPIRNSFLVRGSRGGRVSGPLSIIVGRRDHRSLDIFLLAHMITSSDKKTGAFDVTEWSQTWARAIGIYDGATGASAVSRVWRRLEDDGLITRKRGSLRRTTVTVLREDGSGQPYTRPTGAKNDPYFKLPFSYWNDTTPWHRELTLNGKAVLLISLSREPIFYLVHRQAATRYGVSEETIRRGLNELLDHKILTIREERYIPSTQSQTGWTLRTYYRLEGPFAKDLPPPERPAP